MTDKTEKIKKAATLASAQLAAMRKTVKSRCDYPKCSKEIVGLSFKRFCNDTCKQALRAEVQKEKRWLKRLSGLLWDTPPVLTERETDLLVSLSKTCSLRSFPKERDAALEYLRKVARRTDLSFNNPTIRPVEELEFLFEKVESLE